MTNGDVCPLTISVSRRAISLRPSLSSPQGSSVETSASSSFRLKGLAGRGAVLFLLPWVSFGYKFVAVLRSCRISIWVRVWKLRHADGGLSGSFAFLDWGFRWKHGGCGRPSRKRALTGPHRPVPLGCCLRENDARRTQFERLLWVLMGRWVARLWISIGCPGEASLPRPG